MYQVTLNAACVSSDSNTGLMNVATIVLDTFPERLEAESYVEFVAKHEARVTKLKGMLRQVVQAEVFVIGVRPAVEEVVPQR